jgi:hypothetical protein
MSTRDTRFVADACAQAFASLGDLVAEVLSECDIDDQARRQLALVLRTCKTASGEACAVVAGIDAGDVD